MAIFSKRSRIAELERRNAELEARLDEGHRVQELLIDDILSLREATSTYRGNEYSTYESAVQAISSKYCNKADWGCSQTGAIIDLRAAFTLGAGPKIIPTVPKSEAALELEWARDFFSYNGLDGEMAQEIAKEVEIEGKCALSIKYDDEPFRRWPGMVSTRFIPWMVKKYIVETDPSDYLWYKKIEWKASGSSPAGQYEEDRFVYKKFGGRIFDPNDAQPRIMKALTHIDRLDRALRDLREIDHFFASPIPVVELDKESSTAVTELQAKLDRANWKISKGFVIKGGRLIYVGPDAAGVQNLISEIEMLIKIISGITGIPIHYLGLLDLLRNRATGENTRELIMAATARERQIWASVFTELTEKAMNLFNLESGLIHKSRRLEPTKIKIEIPEITQEHWERIERVLIPAALGGIISKEYVASQIPGIDIDEERKRMAAREADYDEHAEADAEAARSELGFEEETR